MATWLPALIGLRRSLPCWSRLPWYCCRLDQSASRVPSLPSRPRHPNRGSRRFLSPGRRLSSPGPLDEDGYVDYVQALNDRCSEGVTPENNAVVTLIRVIGPKHIAAEHRQEFFKLLGIDELPEDGDYLENYSEYAKRNALAVDLDSFPPDKPWVAADDPQLARWLARYDRHFDQIVAATHLERYYAPLVVDDIAAPALVSVLLPTLQESRSVARGLVSRILLRVGEGRIEEALRDVEALYVFGRQVGHGGTLVEALVGIAINHMATLAELAAVCAPQATEPVLTAHLDRMSRLPPVPSIRESINSTERFMFLDAVAAMARGRTTDLDDGGGPIERILGNIATASIDWNRTLIVGNEWYDRLDVALSYETYGEQQAALDGLNVELEALARRNSNPLLAAASALFGGTAVGEKLGETLVALILPAANAAATAEYRCRVLSDLSLLATYLQIHQLRHGEYPEQLGDLAELPESVLVDQFSDMPFRYTRRDDGYMLYSVGGNREDDGATSMISGTLGGEWIDVDQVEVDGDDLVIRVPLRHMTDSN